MKILSLFDGISCARVALDRAGIKVDQYYASEIDPYAIKISKENWPSITQLGSIKNISYKRKMFRSEMKLYGYPIIITPIEIDLIIGGSPCQDLSIAKQNRKGLDGERSGLFWEYVRLLKELKPKYFVLENVASMPADAKNEITKTLGVEPIMINAALVSAQQRKRLFWTNIPGVTQPEDKKIFLKDILQKGEIPLTNYNTEKVKSNTVRTGGRGSGFGDKHNWDTIRIGQIGKGGQGDRIYSVSGKSVALSANGGGRGAKTGLYMIQTARGFNKGGKRALNGKTPTLSASKWEHNNKLVDGTVIRKLTPIECERLQCLPDNYTGGVSDSQRYKGLGNAFNVDVIAHILSFIPKK
jgi:DNA (cytosine-5)-methyltransferase 3A